MDEEQNKAYLFDVSKTIKHFYETPVIFVNKEDYSDVIFNTMCRIRSALQSGSKDELIDAIADFHLKWLHTINDLETFKKHISELSKEDMYEAISYTIDALGHRLKYYQRFMEKNRPKLSNIDQTNLLADMEIVEEMHKVVTLNLLEKHRCFQNFVDNVEFNIKVNAAIEELLHWYDKINDELAFVLSKYMPGHMPHLSTDLTKTLQQIVDDMQVEDSQSAQTLIEELKKRGKSINSMIRGVSTRDLEISKVVEKIAILNDRIARLEQEPLSAAVVALQHKKDFLEKRLASLENLKTTIKTLHRMSKVDIENETEEEVCACEDFFQFKIFNHLLPAQERERLTTELCYLWDLAVFGERSHKSIISILSAADAKEEFNDELGNFYIDEHSRKIYKLPGDETLYQPNESNKLVPLTDDGEHIYYYDECGRYFIDEKTRQRIYKAHATASEYLMETSGVLLKIKEERNGKTYYYDNYGRYYINSEGQHIYREEDTTSEYENDGLGNLVRIRSHLDFFEPCPDDVNVTEEFKYLKHTVGPALRESIADTILHQPMDPIKYLSLRLIKYRENLELRDKRNREKDELNIEREILLAEEKAAAERAAMEAALLAQGGSEASYDSNLLNYTSLREDEEVSAAASSK
ncbi:unnamed protein product [Chilo suppressalis]|uniref:Uncharacterized protein n=1 Tax=Chilo suppressalis TaxID=168631 RepID=A0ABN8AVK1_CHISP|nr:unnamed protein product [Chilo suppressalis]